ncbi:MAG: hypothetical protein SNF33_01680 [Candidatus Algichlamydia australiensis]|nr:hypothetical protein [Chlamydiales bacterium]
MAGICGIIEDKGDDYSLAFERMLKPLANRGRGPVSTWQSKGVYLGAYGMQIDQNAPQKWLIDGNFSAGDSPEKANGPFAFAHYDTECKELRLARDLLGRCPLYWAQRSGLFVFASEIKSLLAANIFGRIPDLEGLSYFLSFGYIPLDKTLLKDIHKIRSGHVLHLNCDREISTRAYTTYSHDLQSKDPHFSREAYDEKIRQSLQNTSYTPEKSFTLSFERQEKENYFEGIDEVEIPPIDFAEGCKRLPKLLWHLDEPLASPKFISFFRALEEAKSQGKEDLLLAAGSPLWLERHVRIPQVSFQGIRKLYRKCAHQLLITPPLCYLRTDAYTTALRNLATHPWHSKYLSHQFVLNPNQISYLTGRLLSPSDPEVLYHCFPPFEKMGPSLSSLLYLHQKMSFVGHYSTLFDRTSKATGINLITPFLDRDCLAEFAKAPDTTLANYIKRPLVPVYKQPLFAKTTLYDQKTAKPLFSLLKKGVLVDNGLIDPKALHHELHKVGHLRTLWSLLILEVWFRLFVEGDISEAPPETTLEEFIQ